MTINKALAGGAVGLLSGATDGLSPMLTWLCSSLGPPEAACAALAGWLGPLITGLIGGLIVWAIPNK